MIVGQPNHAVHTGRLDLRLYGSLSIDESVAVLLLDFFGSCIQFYVPLSFFLCFISFLYLDLYVLGDDTSIS